MSRKITIGRINKVPLWEWNKRAGDPVNAEEHQSGLPCRSSSSFCYSVAIHEIEQLL